MVGCRLRYFSMIFMAFFFVNNIAWAENQKDKVPDEPNGKPLHLILPIAVTQACARKYLEPEIIAKTKTIQAEFVPERLIACVEDHIQLNASQCKEMVNAFSDSEEVHMESDEEKLKNTMLAFDATIAACMPLIKN